MHVIMTMFLAVAMDVIVAMIYFRKIDV
jgi:hypothetical protein